MKSIISAQCSAPNCSNDTTIVFATEEFGICSPSPSWFQTYCEKHKSRSTGYLGVTPAAAQSLLETVRKNPRDSSWPYALQMFAFGAIAYIQPQGWETQASRDRRGHNRTMYCAMCEEDCEYRLAVKQGWAFPVWAVGDQVATEEICPCCLWKHVKSLLRATGSAIAMAETRLLALGFQCPQRAKEWIRANRDKDVWDDALNDFNARRYTAAPWLSLSPRGNNVLAYSLGS